MWYNISGTVNTGVEKREREKNEEKDCQHAEENWKMSYQTVTQVEGRWSNANLD